MSPDVKDHIVVSITDLYAGYLIVRDFNAHDGKPLDSATDAAAYAAFVRGEHDELKRCISRRVKQAGIPLAKIKSRGLKVVSGSKPKRLVRDEWRDAWNAQR